VAKLTKKQTNELEVVLRNLNRGISFLNRADVEVARHSSMTSADVYRNGLGGPALSVINKQCGSDTVAFETSRGWLQSFLEQNGALTGTVSSA
jgi:hypothetical protein